MIRALILLILTGLGLGSCLVINSPPAALPKGKLILASTLGSVKVPLGAYELTIRDDDKASIKIEKAGRTVFENPKGLSPVQASRTIVLSTHARGMFRLREVAADPCADLTLLSLMRTGNSKTRGITLNGYLNCPNGAVEVFIKFLGSTSGALAFDISLGEDASNLGITGISLMGAKTASERFYGFGAQMGRTEFKGKRFPLIVSEQGVGRGLEPVTFVGNMFYDGAGGEWHSTYAPVPATLTDQKRGLFLLSHANSFVDLRPKNRFSITAHDLRISGGFLGGQPLAMLSDMTQEFGRQRPLPKWVGEGAILGLQGGTDVVRDKLAAIRQANTPVAALWLQDWVGQRITSFGKQLWWSWTLDETRYPGFAEFRAELLKDGIDMLAYINPFLVDITPWSAETGEPRRNLFFEAQQNGYLIKRETGEPYLIRNTSFDAGILDLSNPAAQNWIISVIKDEIATHGFRGWMADFGEGLPHDIKLHSGDKPDLYHNAYPDVWAHLNRRALEELGIEDDAFVFHRSGHFGSAGRATAFWLGDQLVTWDEKDGFRSAIIGHLSSGFSGHGVTHADIGGYTTLTNPLGNYHRSKELFMRWAEFAAFTPIFRTHEGNQPGNNHQVYSDSETVAHFARMTKLFVCLNPYRTALGKELVEKGWPYIRHPMMHYPDDPTMRDIAHEAIMLGGDIFMAPVSSPNTTVLDVTLPDDRWIHFWSGKIFEGGTHRALKAPIGAPLAFVRYSAPLAAKILSCRDKL